MSAASSRSSLEYRRTVFPAESRISRTTGPEVADFNA
jgi:hypothetical protein